MTRGSNIRYFKGTYAEDIAVNYLEQLGYVILQRRLKTQYGEIDILAKDKDTIIAIEVKYRTRLVTAQTSISQEQFKRISKALLSIAAQRANPIESYRIDVIYLDRAGGYEHIIGACFVEENLDC